jgi:hypothetical protein
MAKEHLFCRWDDSSGERFNVETTGYGFKTYTDAEYLLHPKPISEREWSLQPYLRSMTAREELGQFIATRGTCFRDHLRTGEAMEAFRWGMVLCPDDAAICHDLGAATAMHFLLEDFRRQVVADPTITALRVSVCQDRVALAYLRMAQQDLKRIFANRRRTDIDGPPAWPPQRDGLNPVAKDAVCTIPR